MNMFGKYFTEASKMLFYVEAPDNY